MIFENMLYSRESLDGFYISLNSNLLLFEPEWSAAVSQAVTETLKEVMKC